MRRTIGLGSWMTGAIVAAGLAGPAAGDVLHDNGDASGIGGRSNVTESVFGFRRTLLDDFVVPENEIWRLDTFHHHHVWNTMGPGTGEGMEIAIWSDNGCAPGEEQFALDVTGYTEVATGRTFFSRPESESWTTFAPIELGPGHYWFDATIVGPENNFFLLNDAVRLGETWVNYEDLGGFQPGIVVFGVEFDLAWSIEGTVVDTIDFDYTIDRPAIVRPCGDSARVEITAPSGTTLDVTSPTLHYDAGDGFEAVPLERVTFVVFDVVFPPIPCGTDVRYYLSARTLAGDTFTDPVNAPEATFATTTATSAAIAVEDDMETDTGWTVENIDVEEGGWERAIPDEPRRWNEPRGDADGSGQCWVTGPLAVDDLDGGPTHLISPAYDMAGFDDALISFAAFRIEALPDPVRDELTVDISNDDGATWVDALTVPHWHTWREQTLRASAIIAPLTADMRLRFSIADPGSSYTEAGIDALRITELVCDVGFPGDLDRDGDVDFADLLALLLAWGPCPPGGPCPADLDGDLTVGFSDLLMLLASWAPCGG